MSHPRVAERLAGWVRTGRRAKCAGVFAGCLLPWFAGGTAQAGTFTGTVYEDANYGGGAGRSMAASGGVGIAGVTVELYRASNGNFITSGLTNSSGVYSLSSGGDDNQRAGRAVNGAARSTRPRATPCTTP